MSAPSRAGTLPSRMSPTRRRDGRVGDLEPDTVGARKAAFGSAALADRPGETRLDRRRRRVDVVAVEAEPGFEPERIARAETDRLDFRLGEQGAGDAFHAIGADRDLKAVLARIAGAGNVAGEPVEPRCRRLHEGERRRSPDSAAPRLRRRAAPARRAARGDRHAAAGHRRQARPRYGRSPLPSWRH